MGHLTRTYWAPGWGAEGAIGTRDNTGTTERNFPGVDDTEIRNPTCAGVPRERIFPDGSVAKQCGLCGSWTDYYRAGYHVDNNKGDKGIGDVATEEMDNRDGGDNETILVAFY